MNDDAILVAMRLTDATFRHPDEDVSRCCSVCRQQVCLTPSSLAVLRRVTTMAIICATCVKVLPGSEMVLAARTKTELHEEMSKMSKRKGPDADIA